eukprot:1010625-Alexandrium_andersonii.AAC.1
MEGLCMPRGRPVPLCPLQRIAPGPPGEQGVTACKAEELPPPSREDSEESSSPRGGPATPAVPSLAAQWVVLV